MDEQGSTDEQGAVGRMITPQGARALDLINAIDTVKEVDPGFWQGVVTRAVMDMGQAGVTVGQGIVVSLLSEVWEVLPDKGAQPELTPRQQYEAALARHSEAALARHSEAAEDLGRKRQAFGKAIREASEEYEAARAAKAEFEVSPGVPKPEFAKEAGDGHGNDDS